jgi:hypothetical protein
MEDIIMNKKAYQQPTMKVVRIQHKSHILANSVTSAGGPLQYGGAGGDNIANARGNDGWDDWDE